MHRVIGSQDTASIERQLEAIAGKPESSLQLPVHPKDWWLGGELGMIEVIATWARSVPAPELVTHVADDEDPIIQLKALSKRIFGFTALMMASDVLDRSKLRSIRLEANAECKKIAEMMFQPVSKLALGPKVFLLCVDHSTRWAIPWLYAHDKSVRDRTAFLTLTTEILDKIAPRPSQDPIPINMLRDFSAILHELFKNTDEWARTDEVGRPWRRSVRGIAAESHSKDEPALQSVAKNNPALETFLKTVRSRAGTPRLRFVEFTIFDTGIGLARRWLGNSWTPTIPLSEEYVACLECLKKHRTSSAIPIKGLGLNEVMATLGRLNALLRIRTGRLSLYRDFATYPRIEQSDDDSLWDFPSCTQVPTAMAAVFGTHFQILIPVA